LKDEKKVDKNSLVEEATGLKLSIRELPIPLQRWCMKDRRLITLENLMTFFQQSRTQGLDINKAVDGDWFTIGVVGIKTFPKTASSGNKYFVWRIYDLKKTSVAVTVYNNAFEKHFNIQEGSVIVLLNPVFWLMQSDSFTFKITEGEQITKIGMSADYGLCQATSKQQLPCKNVINKTDGSYCSYHIKDKVQKLNRRMVLNDNYGISHIATIKPNELHHNLSKGKSFVPPISTGKDSTPNTDLKMIRPIGRGVGAMYFKQQQGLNVTETAESLLLKHRRRMSGVNKTVQEVKPSSYYHPNSLELYQKDDDDEIQNESQSEEELIIIEDKSSSQCDTFEVEPTEVNPPLIEIQTKFINQLDHDIKDKLLIECLSNYPEIFKRLCDTVPLHSIPMNIKTIIDTNKQ